MDLETVLVSGHLDTEAVVYLALMTYFHLIAETLGNVFKVLVT